MRMNRKWQINSPTGPWKSPHHLKSLTSLHYCTLQFCICTAGEFIKFHDVLECTYLQQLSKIMIVMHDGFAKKILNGWLHTNLLTVEMILFPPQNSWKSSMLKWLNYQKIAPTSFQFWLGFHKKNNGLISLATLVTCIFQLLQKNASLPSLKQQDSLKFPTATCD